MNLFYVYDEYTDIANGEGADKIRGIVMDAFHHPEKPRPEGELLLGEMAREFVPFPHLQPHLILPLSHFQASGFAHRTMCPQMIIAFPISFAILTPTLLPLSVRQMIAPSANTVPSSTTFRFAATHLAVSRVSLSASSDWTCPKRLSTTRGWWHSASKAPTLSLLGMYVPITFVHSGASR